MGNLNLRWNRWRTIITSLSVLKLLKDVEEVGKKYLLGSKEKTSVISYSGALMIAYGLIRIAETMEKLTEKESRKNEGNGV